MGFAPPKMVIGVDEAGYGCSAGPLVVAAFAAVSADWKLEGLTDSKKISEKKREKLYDQLTTAYGSSKRFVVLFVSAEEINKHGLGKCHHRAMAQAAQMLIDTHGIPDRVIFDGSTSYLSGGEGIPKADLTVPAVSAASILAKVSRDRFVREHMHPKYPQYGFDVHVGYWTQDHKAAVVKNGICPEHRRSYKNIQELLRPHERVASFSAQK